MSHSDRIRKVMANVDGSNVLVPEICKPEEIIRLAGAKPESRDLALRTPEGLLEIIKKYQTIRVKENMKFELNIIIKGG